MSEETIILLAILITCSVYSVWLSINGGTRFGGLKWAKNQTWATVVLGVAIIIGWGALVDPHEETQKWLLRFAVGGLALVIRSLWFQLIEQEGVNDA